MSTPLYIRQETQEDRSYVFKLIEAAFKNIEHTDHKEQFLVERLRKSQAFIPELSLVAELEKKIVGYILLSKIKIRNEAAEFDSLAVAPVAVLPEYQNRGIGGLLLTKSHERARALEFKSAVLLGHADYYPRFGYKEAASFDIKLPFDVPSENCMAIELVEQGLSGVTGTVQYPQEFFG
ncbi:putative N-acetyltransferase YhbS [Anseongella ginsenosidimutans]|uniref:Putative N-acetyltransferase YhbS n=1 Tax=Anseongella ginsenosidimutans TaxID=496056 RepID=A0A4V6NZ15_9SPHI|nr:N-acetyltransferase [Anseongella ginsenosidimutans]QEC51940.1 N-acetyltransferase [Anseongella ginsenosidimutans]TCS85027.1 putative N-acetyltransferase YhbS [Anseongella ginsenosidimutans]